MFKYISQILNSLTPAQRILGLVFILCTITIITLGPSFINANTTNCEDLKIRVDSQNTQIIELNKRVTELNSTLLNSESECTNRLISKQKEIMDIVSQIEGEIIKTQTNHNNLKMMSRNNENDSIPQMRTVIIPKQDNKKMLNILKKLKKMCITDTVK